MEYVLGIDIGTGSVKAVAVNLLGQSFEACQQYYSFNAPKPGYHEQNPEEIWKAFCANIKEVIAKTRTQPQAICLSSAMHSLIPVDENGVPLAPMITWADNRSADIAIRLRSSEEGLAIYKATGTPLHAMSPLCKIIWIRENNPELFKKTHKFISIKEYIWYKLFNEFTIDHSLASCTGLFDIVKLTWYDDALSMAGISAAFLSKPVPTNYQKQYSNGHEEQALDPIQPGVPFMIGASDGCLANLGSMANKAGIAAMTIGTSGATRVASNKPLPNADAMTFSYILDAETFICGGPINNGGVAMQWWLKNIFGTEPSEDDYERLFKQINEVPAGSGGIIFLPYLTGERAPIWDSDSCGTFFGIKLQHRQSNFSRAVLEGICFAMKDVLDAVQQNAEPITQINISGGFTNSEVWVQTLADITDTQLVVVQTDDASAVGAAFLALKNMGLISEYPAYIPGVLKVFLPDPQNAEAYRQIFLIYKKLYRDLKDSMHQLYKLNN